MRKHPDVLIIGGGVIGLTTAYLLAQEGARVEILDKDDFGREASWAGAGILPPGNPDSARSPFDQLRACSAAMFPTLSGELRERTGIDNGYLRCGGLEFIGESDEAAAEEWRGEGIRFEAVEGKALARLEPALAAGLGTAYHLPDMAQLRNPRHLKALIAGCQVQGVRLSPGTPVLGFEQQGDRVTAARTAACPLPAGQFMLAAGAWSEGLMSSFGLRPGIRPVRGQIALLNAGVPILRRVLLWGARYLVPRPDGRVLVGSTEEHVNFEKRTTARAISELLALAGRLVPGLANAHLETCWAGLRPGSPDGLPFLGAVPGCTNLFLAAGHFRAGIQLSPATGLVMKDLVLGRKPSIDLEPFRPDRQPAPPHRPAFPS